MVLHERWLSELFRVFVLTTTMMACVWRSDPRTDPGIGTPLPGIGCYLDSWANKCQAACDNQRNEMLSMLLTKLPIILLTRLTAPAKQSSSFRKQIICVFPPFLSERHDLFIPSSTRGDATSTTE